MKYKAYLALLFVTSPLNAKGENISVVTELDFGTVELSPSTSGSVSITALGEESASNVTLIKNPTNGNYTISCAETTGNITIDLNISSTPQGITLPHLEIFYKDTSYSDSDFPASGLANPGTGTSLLVGGTMSLSSATPGTYAPEVEIKLTCPDPPT